MGEAGLDVGCRDEGRPDVGCPDEARPDVNVRAKNAKADGLRPQPGRASYF